MLVQDFRLVFLQISCRRVWKKNWTNQHLSPYDSIFFFFFLEKTRPQKKNHCKDHAACMSRNKNLRWGHCVSGVSKEQKNIRWGCIHQVENSRVVLWLVLTQKVAHLFSSQKEPGLFLFQSLASSDQMHGWQDNLALVLPPRFWTGVIKQWKKDFSFTFAGFLTSYQRKVKRLLSCSGIFSHSVWNSGAIIRALMFCTLSQSSVSRKSLLKFWAITG